MPIIGILLILSAVSIAGVAGYFSIYGLASIYHGAFLSVVLMGGVLEAGKLVATSYLYQFWKDTSFLLKSYLIAAIFGLMLITSGGIFGYLSSAYQQDAFGIKDINARIELIDKEYEELSIREAEIDTDISRIGSNYVSARMGLIKQYAPEKNAITERRNEIRALKFELSSKQLEVEAHTGPIIYIAKAMDKTIDDAVIWMSILIIIVFDPLAVALTIAANSVFVGRRKKLIVEPDNNTMATLQQEFDELRERNTQLMNDVLSSDILKQSVVTENDILNEELEYMKSELEQTQQELKQLAESSKRMVDEREEFRTKLYQSEDAHSLDIESLNLEADRELTAQIELLDNSIADLERARVRIKTLEDELFAQSEDAQTVIASLQDQIVQLRKQASVQMSALDRALLHKTNVTTAKEQ